MRFPLSSMVSSSYLVMQRYSFFNFFNLSPLVWWCLLPVYIINCKFPFLRAFRFFLDLVVLFFPSFAIFHFSLLAWHIFTCQTPSLYRYCISSPLVARFSSFFTFRQTMLCWPYTLGGWFFLVICEVCIRLCIS